MSKNIKMYEYMLFLKTEIVYYSIQRAGESIITKTAASDAEDKIVVAIQQNKLERSMITKNNNIKKVSFEKTILKQGKMIPSGE